MTKYTTFKKGYRISVVSWENDADNYRTMIEDGFTKDQTYFIIEMLKALGNNSDISNLYEPSETELRMFGYSLTLICMKHQEKFDVLGFLSLDKFLDLEDDNSEEEINEFVKVISKFLRKFLGNSEYFIRVYSSHTIQFIPEDILIEDVTDTFK